MVEEGNHQTEIEVIDPWIENMIPDVDDTMLKETQQWGFYMVATTPNDIPNILSEINNDLGNKKRQWGIALRDAKHLKEIAIKRRLADGEKKIASIEEMLNKLKASTINLEVSRGMILDDIKTIEEELGNLYKLLDEHRFRLLEKRIAQIKVELRQLLDLYHEQVKEKQGFNEQLYAKHSNTIATKQQDIKNIKDKTKTHLDKVAAKTQKLKQIGISPLVSKFILNFGLIGLIASGILFSVFAADAEVKLGNENALFFVLKTLFGFNYSSYASNKVWVWLGFAILLIAVICFILLFSYITDKLLQSANDRISDEDPYEKKMYSIFFAAKSNGFQLNGIVKASSIYTFMLNIAPAVLAIGLFLLILLVAGDRQDRMEELSLSAGGIVLGSCIAMLLAALSYVYVVKVLDARLYRDDNSQTIPGLTTNNRINLMWELIVVIGLLIIAAFVVPILSIEKKFIASTLFIVVAIATGFSIGFGLYFKGLFDNENDLESRFIRVSIIEEFFSVPLPFDQLRYENKQFFYRITKLLQEYEKVFRHKVKADDRWSPAGSASNNNTSKKKPSPPKNWIIKIYNRIVRVKEEELDTDFGQTIELSTEDKNAFIELTSKIEFEVERRKRAYKELDNANEEIENIKNHKGPDIEKLEKDLETARDFVARQFDNLGYLNIRLADAESRIDYAYQQLHRATLEGVEMGRTYRWSRILPHDRELPY